MIAFACPACGCHLKTRDDLAGKKARCSHCGQPVPVPPPVAANIDADAPTLPPAPASLDDLDRAPSSPAGDDRTLPTPGNGSAPPSRGGDRPTVPGYEILGELGRGGMGVVYKARQVRLRRLVALKMILAGAHAGDSELARFRSEAEAVARLQHPNIVQIHEIGEQGGLPFFSLEFLDGGTLAGQLDGTPWPSLRAAQMVEVLARAMQAAHAHQIVHRDLKPANVLLTAEGTPKITDFGLAKQLDDESGQTQAGQIMGTPSYMAPEQAEGSKDVGPLADVYALGAILYELLTGRPPFKGATAMDTILQVAVDDPVPPTRLQPKAPRDLETICLKRLQKAPGKRYASAEALAEDLRRFQAGEPIHARPVALLERLAKWARRRPAVAALLAVTLLTAAVGFALVTWQWQEAEQARRLAEQAQLAEAAQRREAETAREVAEGQRKQAETARQKEAEQRRLFQHQSVKLLVERGLTLAEQGDVGRGLLWMARSLQVASPEDVDLQQVVRSNLGHWGRPFRPLRAVLGHGSPVQGAVFSPNGKWALTSGGATARLWETATGQPAGQPFEHTALSSLSTVVAFRPDSAVFVTVSRNNTAQLRSAPSGKLVGAAMPHPSAVRAVAFSPDGGALLTVCGPLSAEKGASAARLWDAATGQPLGPPFAQQGFIYSAAFAKDSITVLTGCHDGTARLWSAPRGKPMQPKGEPLVHDSPVRIVAFSDNGRTFLTCAGKTARVWHAVTRQPIGAPLTHRFTILAAAFSPDSKTIVTAALHTARLWNAADGKERGDPMLHRGPITSVAFSPDSDVVATGSRDQTVRVWEVKSGKSRGPALPHPATVLDVAFRSDGARILTRTPEQVVRLWEARSGPDLRLRQWAASDFVVSPDGKTFLMLPRTSTTSLFDAATGNSLGDLQHKKQIRALAFSPDGAFILTGSDDQTAQLWRRGAEKRIERVGPPLKHQGAVMKAAFSPDGKTLLTVTAPPKDAGPRWTVQRWDAATGKPVSVPWQLTAGVRKLAYSADGRTVLALQMNKALLWDATGKQIGQPLEHPPPSRLNEAVFSPDGKLVLTAGRDGTARLWDAATGQPVGDPLEHTDAVRAAAFRPDGKVILTGSSDRTARQWQPGAGQSVGTPLIHQSGVAAVAFSPDGKTILTGCDDFTARLWDAATGAPLGMPFPNWSEVSRVGFLAGGRSILTKQIGGSAFLWALPPPLSGEAEPIVLWSEAATGLTIDADGVVVPLDAGEWAERRKRLEKLGAPLLAP